MTVKQWNLFAMGATIGAIMVIALVSNYSRGVYVSPHKEAVFIEGRGCVVNTTLPSFKQENGRWWCSIISRKLEGMHAVKL